MLIERYARVVELVDTSDLRVKFELHIRNDMNVSCQIR